MPGSQFSPMPNRPGDLERRIRDLERLVMEMAAARTLENATVGAGGITIQGGKLTIKDLSGNILATLDATGLNVTGTETVTGTLNVTGNTIIGGTLSLPAGIINNDALANPVIPGVVNASATNFGLGSGSFADVVSASATVPSGCARLLATASGWIDCYNQKTTGGNNGSGGDYLYCKIKVGSTVGLRTATGVSGSNGQATAGSGYSALLTGLTPGSSVSLSTQGVSDYGIDPNTGNIAILSATLLWLR